MPPFPAAAPTVDGTRVTVDAYLQRPLEIARDLVDLTVEEFFTEDLFQPGDNVPAGAVLYSQLRKGDLYPEDGRGVGRKTPGGQFPVIVSSPPELQMAYSEEYGGKFYVTYDAIKKNRFNEFDRSERLLANDLVRKWNGLATALLNATVTALGLEAVVVGQDWGDPTANIYADLLDAQWVADARELGIQLDTLVVHPNEWRNMLANEKFQQLFAPATRERMAREGFRMSRVEAGGFTIRKSHQQAAGTALAVDSRQVGGRHSDQPPSSPGDNTVYEQGIAVQTWDDPHNTRRWVQGWKSEILYVSNPLAVYRLEGLDTPAGP